MNVKIENKRIDGDHLLSEEVKMEEMEKRQQEDDRAVLERELMRSLESSAALLEKVSVMDLQLAEAEATIKLLKNQENNGEPRRRGIGRFLRSNNINIGNGNFESKCRIQAEEIKRLKEKEKILTREVFSLQSHIGEIETKYNQELEKNKEMETRCEKLQQELEQVKLLKSASENDERGSEVSSSSNHLGKKGPIPGKFEDHIRETKDRLLRLRRKSRDFDESHQKNRESSEKIVTKIENLVEKSAELTKTPDEDASTGSIAEGADAPQLTEEKEKSKPCSAKSEALPEGPAEDLERSETSEP